MDTLQSRAELFGSDILPPPPLLPVVPQLPYLTIKLQRRSVSDHDAASSPEKTPTSKKLSFRVCARGVQGGSDGDPYLTVLHLSPRA